MMPGDQKSTPKVVVPYYTKNSKTNFLAILVGFSPIFHLSIPHTSTFPNKIQIMCSHDLAQPTPKILAKTDNCTAEKSSTAYSY